MNEAGLGTWTGELLASILAGLAVFMVMAAAWLWWLSRGPAWRRVEALIEPSQKREKLALPQKLRETLTSILSKLSGPAKPQQDWQASKLKRDLVQAGFRSPTAINAFQGARVLSLFLLPAVCALSPLPRFFQPERLPLILAFSAGIGYLLPGFILQSKLGRRRDRVLRELPDVLDLLVISVEAGLGLDAAIRRVADEVRISAPTLAGELGTVSLELKAGIPRDMSLKNLANRCGVDEISSLVSMLVQADRFGVSVGRSLRVHSDSVRVKRRQKMEELAAKVPLKLLFPVLFMIFPAIMVVMAGPAIIRVSESILK